MKTKLQKQLKRAELSKAEKECMDVRTVLSKCVTKQTLGTRINGIQI